VPRIHLFDPYVPAEEYADRFFDSLRTMGVDLMSGIDVLYPPPDSSWKHSDLVRFFVTISCLGWVLSGCPVFRVDSRQSAAFVATSCSSVTVDELRFPYCAFGIVTDEPLVDGFAKFVYFYDGLASMAQIQTSWDCNEPEILAKLQELASEDNSEINTIGCLVASADGAHLRASARPRRLPGSNANNLGKTTRCTLPDLCLQGTSSCRSARSSAVILRPSQLHRLRRRNPAQAHRRSTASTSSRSAPRWVTFNSTSAVD
jgi:hypothetical protein